MGLKYQNLEDRTREFMLQEIERDVAEGRVYISNYLNEQGASMWVEILREAARSGDDESIAQKIREDGLLKFEAERKKPKGGYTMARVPHTAAETLGEGEFGRYYVRGLCARAIEDKIPHLQVYRAKAVAQPRPGSEEKVGSLVEPSAILDDLRNTVGVEPLLGLPPGPNSGLTLMIPTA